VGNFRHPGSRHDAKDQAVATDLSNGSLQQFISPVPEIVTFPAEVNDSNSARVGAQLFAACRPGVTLVIADLSRTQTCDSSAIRYLVVAHDQAAVCGLELRIVIRSAQVRRLLELTSVAKVLHIYPAMAEALAA